MPTATATKPAAPAFATLYEPTDDRVVVKELKPQEESTKAGIIIPGAARKDGRALKGVVLAVGPGAWKRDDSGRRRMSVKVGDTVYFSQYGGSALEIDEEKMVVLSESDLLCRAIDPDA